MVTYYLICAKLFIVIACLFLSSACVHTERCLLWTASCSCSIGPATESWETEASWCHRRLAASASGASPDRHTLTVRRTERERHDGRRERSLRRTARSSKETCISNRSLTVWGEVDAPNCTSCWQAAVSFNDPPVRWIYKQPELWQLGWTVDLASRLYHSWQPTTMSLSRSHLCLVVWDSCTVTAAYVYERAWVWALLHLCVCVYEYMSVYVSMHFSSREEFVSVT